MSLLPDPSARLVDAFRAAASRMTGLGIVNPALDVEAIGFAPWEGSWLGVLLTPWFMNLTLVAHDPARWHVVAPGEKRRYHFPAGAYDFIGAQDAIAGEYQMCSLFSPMQRFEDAASARLVAQLARDALFDAGNAEKPERPIGEPAESATGEVDAPGPIARLEKQLDAPLSRRDLLRGRLTGGDRGDRG